MSEYLSENLLDTSDAREKIFTKIRAMQRRCESDRSAEFEQASMYSQLHKRRPQPKAPSHLIELFHLQSNKLSTTLSYVSKINDTPTAVRNYLADNGLLGHQASVWPAISHLPWTAAKLDVVYGAPSGDHLIGIGAVLCAVAETGTLVLASGEKAPASTHLLPETHIAVLHADQIVHTMEDAFDRVHELLGKMPRALNFVSGPSRTGDIEQTIVLGAHGPYRVHCVIVGAPDPTLNDQLEQASSTTQN